jgi:hypothetical protein
MISEGQALDVLRECGVLLTRIEASGEGIYYQPTDEDRPIIERAMRLCVDYSGPENELRLRLLRQRVGLHPSGWGLVRGMVDCHVLQLPGVAHRRMEELRQALSPGVQLGSEYERLCATAQRQAQEWQQDWFVVEDGDGGLSLAGDIEAIDWAQAIVVTAVGPDGIRRVERRPRTG